MSKEEKITQITENIRLSTFKPKIGETIILTVNPNKIDVNTSIEIFNAIKEIYSDYSIILKPDGITLESNMEDDLK